VTVLPELRGRAGPGVILSREILVMGLGESHTHELIKDVYEAATDVTIAYLAGSGLVRLRLTAKASTEAVALGLLRPLEEDLRARLGEASVEGHATTMAEAVGNLLRHRNLTVAVAESLTGGLLAVELTSEPGASDYFRGGVVVYATKAKHDLLDLDESILMGSGAVSEEAAGALAGSVARRFSADLGLATTGVAGPAELEGKPVGTVYLGAFFHGATEVRQIRGYGDRTNIRRMAVNSALDLGRRLIVHSDG
jgi:nicotinamide-nucleotide amidase